MRKHFVTEMSTFLNKSINAEVKSVCERLLFHHWWDLHSHRGKRIKAKKNPKLSVSGRKEAFEAVQTACVHTGV